MVFQTLCVSHSDQIIYLWPEVHLGPIKLFKMELLKVVVKSLKHNVLRVLAPTPLL